MKTKILSFKGKITISNNLAPTPIIYWVILIDVPEPAIKEINNIIQNFVWDGNKYNLKTIFLDSPQPQKPYLPIGSLQSRT